MGYEKRFWGAEMRGLISYMEDLIKVIFTTTGQLPIEIWLNQGQHPYLKNLNDRLKVGTFEGSVQVYVSGEIKIGEPEYLLSLDKPSKKILFEREV